MIYIHIYIYICSSAPPVLTCDTCDLFFWMRVTRIILTSKKEKKRTKNCAHV